MDFRVVLHVNAPPRRLTGDEVTRVDAPDVARSRGGRGRRHESTISDYWARHRETFALGVDGWWPDDGDELDRESRIARHRLYYQGPLLDRPNVRPWNLQRTGSAGVARYGGWIWSGDVDSRWETLATHVAIGQNHSLSLSPYWGSDIGGFYPGPELTGELYVRWIQFGAFCASFRAHGRTWHLRRPWGWNTGDAGPIEHNDWRPPESDLTNAEVEPICRKFLELRYRLLPYAYTLCRVAHDTGLPLMRALWLHYPEDEQAITRGDEYLWGRDILVAPVTERGAAERTLYLPAGEWYDFWTGERHAGGREITREVDLATMPLYVRAGAIIPLDPVRQHTGEIVNELTTVRIYTGADGEFHWYEDDGASLDYQRGQFAWTRLTWDDNERQLTIDADGGELDAVARARRLKVELVPGGETHTLEYDGTEFNTRFPIED
jgi:alpha-glucosidase/alpha-D-xyloside xylohydrolase